MSKQLNSEKLKKGQKNLHFSIVFVSKNIHKKLIAYCIFSLLTKKPILEGYQNCKKNAVFLHIWPFSGFKILLPGQNQPNASNLHQFCINFGTFYDFFVAKKKKYQKNTSNNLYMLVLLTLMRWGIFYVLRPRAPCRPPCLGSSSVQTHYGRSDSGSTHHPLHGNPAEHPSLCAV